MRIVNRALLIMACAATLAVPGKAAEVDALLPEKSEAVIYVNVKQMLDSDIIKKNVLDMWKQALQGADAQEMLKELGLDPLKDVDTVTMGTWGKDPKDMKVLGVVRGRFDTEKLFAAAEKYSKKHADNISIVEEGDYKLIKFTGKGGNDKPGYASAADANTIVVGSDPKDVATSLKAAAAKAKPSLSKDLSALVLKQDAKATLFMCGITEGKIPNNFNIPPIPGVDANNIKKLKEGVGNMNNVAITIRLGKEMSFDLTMGMKDADSADDFGSAVSSLVDTAKMFLPLLAANQDQFKALVDDFTGSLKSDVKAKSVTLGFKISAEAMQSAAKGPNQ